MKKQYFSIPNSTRLIAKFTILLVIVISILDLIGWIFNVTFLKGFNSEGTPMKVITASCFILSSIAILFFQISSKTGLQKFLSKTIAIIIGIVGLLTIAVYINVLRTGIDFPFVNFPFFNLFLAPATRMALITASLFFVIGIVLFLLSSDKIINANIAHAFILPVLIVSYIVVASYILKVHSIHSIQNIGVALNSGIAFLTLSLAVLFNRSDTWLMKVFISENAGGIMARKLLPILITLPVIIGWFRIYGEESNLFESKLGVLLVAITYVICFLFLIWLTAKYSNRTDYKYRKKLTEAKLNADIASDSAKNAMRIAEDAMNAKQQFLANMSHEIRTPMNAIIGFTKVVLKTDLSSSQKEYLTAIKLSGDALIVLINDILDLAKVDAGKLTFEQTPFNMSLSISAMLHLFELKIQEKNLELVKDYDNNIPGVLIGDPARLHQIILNLMSNAVKFTTKGKISVSIRLLNEDAENATIKFSITDTGIGIPENEIENIFDNFQQASSSTARLYGGTGLGLAIVKQLVERQGGSLNVKSKIDEGSTFSFIIDFKKTNLNVGIETEKLELNADIKNIKVLVVEDVALNQLLMKTILYDFGFELDIADNGKIAIEKLQAKSYDIILMDLQMPVMNGFEATDYIRNKMKSNIPIIALTADVTTVDLEKCKVVGINDYISKPLDEKLLYKKIVGLVKKL